MDFELIKSQNPSFILFEAIPAIRFNLVISSLLSRRSSLTRISTAIRARNFFNYAFSITIAEAPPPPLQIAAAPTFALFCSRTLIKVTIILAPEQPSG
jgi:hypothetical protein